jgi:hypothetical protein
MHEPGIYTIWLGQLVLKKFWNFFEQPYPNPEILVPIVSDFKRI